MCQAKFFSNGIAQETSQKIKNTYKNGSFEINLEGKNLLKMNDIINYQYVLQCVVDSIINLPSATTLKNLYKPKKILEIHIILIKAKVDFRSKFSVAT